MDAAETRLESRRHYEVRPRELDLLLIEIVLLGGVALGWVFSLGPRLFGADSLWADAAWKGLGFFLFGLALYPVLRIQSRNARGYEVRFGRWLAWDLAGSVAGTMLYLLLR